MNTEPNVSPESEPRGLGQLKALLACLPGRLAAISSEAASAKPGPDRWSAKEELGHLIDSAANNHQRIVRAQLEDNLSLPSYDGDRWVELHGYQNSEWTELISLWRADNLQLLSAAESAPLSSWSHTLTVGGSEPSEPMTLGFVLDDYVTHMSHHLRHIGIEVNDILANVNPATIYPEKLAQTEYPINELMRRRWSPRVFEQDRAVEKEKLLAMLEAARWAPSCFNDQPRNFVVFDMTDQAALEKARECLLPGNAWARKAPVLMVSVARETFEHNGQPNRWGQHDTGLATENLLLEAVELGLAAHAMGGFDADRTRVEFGIPEGFTPMAMIAIGYPYRGPLEELEEELHGKELASRERKPLGEIAFAGKWNARYSKLERE